MITSKLILCILAGLFGCVSFVLAIKSYKISLRNELRLKYNRIAGSNVHLRLELMHKEYNQKISLTVTVCIVAILLIAYAAYVTVLCLKNNISLIY